MMLSVASSKGGNFFVLIIPQNDVMTAFRNVSKVRPFLFLETQSSSPKFPQSYPSWIKLDKVRSLNFLSIFYHHCVLHYNSYP